jgi:hypothetical protein
MPFKALPYITILFTISFCLSADAQCHLKKSKNGNIVSAENPEHYIYLRTDSTYSGLSIRSLYSKQSGVKKYQLIILYTSNLTDTVQQIKFNSIDNTSLAAGVKLLGSKKNDNPKQHTKVYQLELDDNQITYFTAHLLQSVELLNDVGNKSNSLVVTEPSFLADQLSCLLSN